MKDFDLKKYLAENKLSEALPVIPGLSTMDATEVFSDEQLDYITDTMIGMYEKLGLDAGKGETDVVKADALFDRIKGFFETLN